MAKYSYDIEKLEADHQELAEDIQKIFPANTDDDNLWKHFQAARNLNLDSQTSALLAITERLEALVEAVDRNTAATYDTAKPQPISDQFIEQIEKAMMFIDTHAKDTPAPSTGQSIANKLKSHLMDYRRVQS